MLHTLKDDVEDLDRVMQMYSLLECGQNYFFHIWKFIALL